MNRLRAKLASRPADLEELRSGSIGSVRRFDPHVKIVEVGGHRLFQLITIEAEFVVEGVFVVGLGCRAAIVHNLFAVEPCFN